MRVLIACKRGNIAERSKSGHCLCADCKTFRNSRSAETKRPGYSKEWAQQNSDKVAAYTKKWNGANQEKRAAIVTDWRKRNPDKVKQMNKKAGAKWASENKGARNAITNKRRAALLQRTPAWADLSQIKQVYEEAARLAAESGIPHEVDHIIPLQGQLVSGLHVPENLRIITRSQNRSKQNKHEEAQSFGGL